MRLLPSGERALLVELSDLDEVLALAEAVRGLAGIEDVVPGERTLLVTVAVPGDLEPVRRALPEMTGASVSVVAGARALEIRVMYDGPDLADVAAQTGLTVADVIAAHQATPWRVGFGGFAPGFAYLVAARGPATTGAASERPRGISRARRPVLRHLPAPIAGRLAADRPHGRGALRRRRHPAGSAPTRHDRTVRCRVMMPASSATSVECGLSGGCSGPTTVTSVIDGL